MSSPSRRPDVRWLILTGLALAGLVLALRYHPPAANSVQAVGREDRSGPPDRAPSQAPARLAPAPASDPAAAPVSAPQLFTYVQPANTAELDAVMRAPTHKINYVKLDEALLEGKESPFWQKTDEGRLTLPLPQGGSLAVVIHGSEMMGSRRFTSTGFIEGRPESRAIFAYNEGFLRAVIEDAEVGSYELRAATADLEQFYQVDPALVPACGGPAHFVPDAGTFAELAKRTAQAGVVQNPGSEEISASAAADSTGANMVVHLMMLYTQGVRANLTGAQRVAAIQSDFDGAVAQVNDDFARSLISARIKLIKIAEVSYPGDEVDPDLPTGTVKWQSDMLNALARTTDTGTRAMNEIHALRDQVGADLVNLIQHRSDSSSSGIGYVLETPGDNLNQFSGFTVVSDAYLTAIHTFSHEIGHNLGNAHARGDALSTGTKDGAYTYSYGYRFTGQDGRVYHDIMAYDPGTRVFYFSNPDLRFPAPINASLGIAIGKTGEANASLTIDQSAFEVASYRLQTQTPTNTGTLVNVSTRAFVGTGEQQLIAGFSIAGTQPKKMLIRVAGPALVPYGVPGLLLDPKITLIRTDVTPFPTIAENHAGWGTQTGATSGVTANDIKNAVPGAFAFADGSKDAALLVTLPPGNYTANVESVSGGTGVALVEAYEVDRNGNKLFNLSTRAYSAKGNEIYGGFVVQGDPGTTKRVLIRAQGPSLAKAGISNPLNDPYLELYNSDSKLIMENDDWALNASSTAGVTDDSKPVAAYYNEVKIAATGLSPSNRREPCILVDLPPGLYSAIIRPFEDLTRSPPAVASPGVAIIEVFEINP